MEILYFYLILAMFLTMSYIYINTPVPNIAIKN